MISAFWNFCVFGRSLMVKPLSKLSPAYQDVPRRWLQRTDEVQAFMKKKDVLDFVNSLFDWTNLINFGQLELPVVVQ